MTERKKVLWLIKGLGAGGAEKLMSMSLPYLDRGAFDYRVAYLLKSKTDLVPEFEHQGIPVFCLDAKKAYDLRIIFKIYRLLRSEKIDILHIHSPSLGIMGRLAAVPAGVRATISTEHLLVERQHPLVRLGSILTYPMNRATIAVSEAVRHSVLRYKTTRPETIYVVHNGLDFNDGENEEVDIPTIKHGLGIDNGRLVVGTVAHIRPEKGHQYLLEAARLVIDRLPEVNFVVVGRGKEADLSRLKELAGRLGIRDRVIFTGFRPDAFRLTAAFDVFVLPSLWEAFGIVLLEAMSLGKPVVATRVDGIPEVIDDGVDGFLVAPRDPVELASRILELLQDAGLRRRMGQAGRQKVEKKFRIEYAVKATEQVYRTVLNGKEARA